MVKVGRAQLVRTVAAQTGLSQNQVSEVLNAILGIFKSTLVSKGTVSIPGWFTMGTKLRKGRTGRNPRTGEALIIPEKNIPYIKAGSELKDAAEE
jgi:DNA-binding protein HU-beta